MKESLLYNNKAERERLGKHLGGGGKMYQVTENLLQSGFK